MFSKVWIRKLITLLCGKERRGYEDLIKEVGIQGEDCHCSSELQWRITILLPFIPFCRC